MPSLKDQPLGNDFGRRLLPAVFDHVSATTPDRFYASILKGDQVSQGFQDITFRQVKNAVDSLAWSISNKHGQTNDFKTICYVGEPDLRTAIMFLAVVKCGYKLLLISPRNPAPANVALLKQTACSLIYHSAMLTPLAQGLKRVMPEISWELLPELDKLMASSPEHFEYSKTFEDAMNDPVLILHSSGSTGLPKPITMTHATFASIEATKNLRQIPGRKNHDFRMWDMKPFGRFYTIFPPFHMGGFGATVAQPIFSDGAVPVLGPPLRPPTGAMALEILQNLEIVGLFVVPSIIEQMVKEPGAVDILQKLKFICYAGGSLSPTVGNQLCQHVDLCQFYGTTETISPPQLVPTAEEWEYMTWHPDFEGDMEPQDDGTFELVYYYDKMDPSLTAVVHNLPGLKEYRTKDLFQQHPQKPGLWRFYGRKDDIIVLANGEKFNPVPLEMALAGNASIAGAVVVGQGKAEAALLLEPREKIDSPATFLDTVWPAIEHANELLPGQGRIIKSRIVVGTPEKPFIRAGKGTVIRRLTADLYKTELEALYRNDPTATQPKRSTLRARFDLADINGLVRTSLNSVSSRAILNENDDLFAAGLDSVKSVEVLGILKSELQPHIKDGSDAEWLDLKFLYQCPTINAISKAIFEFLNDEAVPNLGSASDTSLMEKLIQRFTQDLPTRNIAIPHEWQGNNLKVGLLGSRGNVGRALLKVFEHETSITKIVCIDRAQTSNAKTGVTNTPDIQHLTIDYQRPNLGLSDHSVKEALSDLDIIVFNAWPVDFNRPLQNFVPNLEALRSVVNIAAAVGKPGTDSRGLTHIVFVSSVSAASVASLEPGIPVSGYGQSKHVAEQILCTAARDSGISSSIVRVTQVTPAAKITTSTGEGNEWSKKEWFPSMCKASKILGAFPVDLGPIDWIPVDVLSVVLAELAQHDTTARITPVTEPVAYNLRNPNTISWSLIADAIKNRDPSIKLISMADWVKRLKEHKTTHEKTTDAQAFALLPFYEGILGILNGSTGSIENSQQGKQDRDGPIFHEPSEAVSPAFAALKSISQENIRDWIEQLF